MILELLSALRANSTIQELLGGDHIYAKHTDYLGNCVLYENYTTAANKIAENTRLTITLVADNLSLIASLEQEVKDAILTLADNPLTQNILQVELNGGGGLYDYDRQKHHRTLYFTIISRSEI